MTPSKEALGDDAATLASLEWFNGDDSKSSRELALVIRRHFADVIRKAAALDAIEQMLRLQRIASLAIARSSYNMFTCVGVAKSTNNLGSESESKKSLPAAIESLAAKIGGKDA